MDDAVKPLAACMPQQRVPNFFIVGHPKCGTTALYEMLRRHPQVYMPQLKEPQFFGEDMYPRGHQPHSSVLPETPEEYLALFDAALPDQRVGEASPLYLTSRTAASQIAEVRPDARIIAILREPADFLRSLHLQWVRSRLETKKDFRKAILLEEARRQGKRIPRASLVRPLTLLYSDFVRYVEQLRRYHAVFPPEQVLVLIYDDFRQSNETTMRSVLGFLDVEVSSPIDVMEVNPTVRLRSRQLEKMVRAVSVGRGPLSRAVKASVKALTPGQLPRRALYATQRNVIYGDPPPPDESFMRELRRRFTPEVVALSEYLDRDLITLWGYDSVG